LKILVCQPFETVAPYIPIHTESLHPSKIRAMIIGLLLSEESTKQECHISTMNRTILDMVGKEKINLAYEDVFIVRGGKLFPILKLYDKECLAHFSLGDLLDKNQL